MTTKVVDSTVSRILQDNSSVEYVAPEKSPIATIPTVQNEERSFSDLKKTSLFDFNAVHNGVQCIESLDPKDKGTERQYRFTRALLCVLFGVKSENTITNHVDALVNRGAIDVVKNLTTSPMVNSNGASHETTLYDLKVFNYLVMRLDTDRAWEMKAKFNDVLVKAETGCIRTVEDMINNPDTAIQLLSQIKSLRQQNKQLEMERDEAIRTKTQYQSNLASQMSGRVGGLTSALNRARTENAELREENVTLKDGWWSVSDVARMIARVCKLPRVYANDTLINKCRIGLRYFAAKRNRMTRMLEVDGMHQDKYGNLVQNTAEHFDDDTVADFRQWVDENPEMFPKIKSVLVITMNDENPSE